MKENVKRGEIYYADLSPVVGSEQGGIRPVLIIQNDIGNRYSPTTVVVPITSKIEKKSKQPTHVPVICSGLSVSSMALLEQIKTIDKIRLKERVGVLPADIMREIEDALLISVGIQ